MSNKLTLKDFDQMYPEKWTEKIKAMKKDLKYTEQELKDKVNEYKTIIGNLINDKKNLEILIEKEEDKITE